MSKEGGARFEGGGGRYQVVCPLASGGMGKVDLVVRRDGRFARLFAQKRLRPHLVDDESVRRMFLDEGRIAGLVRHPQVVSVVDVGEDQAGPYLVMDFVEGVSLAELVGRVAARGEQVPLGIGLRIAAQVAEGLHAVHETCGPDGELLQLIHRDVSPQNVLIAFDGMARVSDFGIAKALGRDSRTTTGVLKGKLGYLAPERLRFEEPDRRADLFSFGVVLFELLAGQRLYDGGDEGPRRILNEPPPDLAECREDVPPELIELLFELLAKDCAQRPRDAAVVARRLERMLADAVAADGPADVGAYVAGLFAPERAALRARVAAVSLEPTVPSRAGARRPTGWLALTGLIGASVLIAVLATAGAPPASHAPVLADPQSSSDARTMPAAIAAGVVSAAAAPEPDNEDSPVRRAIRRPRKHGHPTVPVRAEATSPGTDGCDPPYTLNAAGERQFKLRCLVDVRR